MEIIKNAQNAEAFSFVVPLVDAMSRPDYKANPTLAAGDIKVIRYDTAAWDVSNIATLPSTIAGATSLLEVELTIAEMTADDDTRPIIVQFIDQTSPKEWDDQMVVIRLGAIQSNLKEIDDESVASNAATLKLKQLDIQNSAGSALIAKGTGGNGSGMELVGHGTGAGLKLTGGATGKDIEASEIGAPVSLGDGASLSDMLTSIAGKTANAGSYDRTTDSNEAIRDRGDAEWVTANIAALNDLDAQEVRDSMKLAPTVGAPAADSVDQHLDDIITDIATVDGKVDTAIADVATVDGKVDTAITDVAAVDGKVDGVQTTVDGISNVTRLTASVAGYYLVPAAGSTYHYIQVAVKNTDGSMEDPDGQDFGIRLSGSSSGTILNRLLKTSGGVNLDASGVANCDYKLERNGVGLYSMWYKSTTADTNETLSFRFGWEENALVLYELRPSQTVDIAPATTVLADNAVNKDIIAEALKERDVSGTSAVSGSIYHDVMTDVATAITDIATVDGKVDTVIVDIGNLNDLSIIDVEGAVDDKLEELIAEPSVGVPAATQSVRGILAYWWQILRNKGTMSKSTGDKVFHNSTGTAMFKKHTQDDGTTYVENEASSV